MKNIIHIRWFSGPVSYCVSRNGPVKVNKEQIARHLESKRVECSILFIMNFLWEIFLQLGNFKGIHYIKILQFRRFNKIFCFTT